MKLIVKIDPETNLFIEDVLVDDNDQIPVDCIDVSMYPIQEGLHLPMWDAVNLVWLEGFIRTLSQAQSDKILEVTNAYMTELNSTFTSEATGSPLVYDYSTVESQDLWKNLKDSIAEGYIPDALLTAFPVTLANGSMLPHTKQQLTQIFGEPKR